MTAFLRFFNKLAIRGVPDLHTAKGAEAHRHRQWLVTTSISVFTTVVVFAVALIGSSLIAIANWENAAYRLPYTFAPAIFFLGALLIFYTPVFHERILALHMLIALDVVAVVYFVSLAGPQTGMPAFLLPICIIPWFYFNQNNYLAFFWSSIAGGAIVAISMYFSVHAALLPLSSFINRIAFAVVTTFLGASVVITVVALWINKQVTSLLLRLWRAYWHIDTTDYATMLTKRRRLKLTVAFAFRFPFLAVGVFFAFTEVSRFQAVYLGLIAVHTVINCSGMYFALRGILERPIIYALVFLDALLIYSSIIITHQLSSPVLPFVIFIVMMTFILGDIRVGLFSAAVNFTLHFINLYAYSAGFLDFSKLPRAIGIFDYMFIPSAIITGTVTMIYVLRTVDSLETDLVTQRQDLAREFSNSERLLLNILPTEVSLELKTRGHTTPREYPSATVLFTDFVGFTRIAEKLTATELVRELDQCFSYFDNVAQKYGLEKLKTIGDAYMAVAGIPVENKTHAIDAALAALEIQAFMNQMKQIKEQQGYPYWELRLGMHTGPLVAGVVGEKKFAYDVWGDTVNTASRMESSGAPGAINISQELYEQIQYLFRCEYRGKVYAKNKGEIGMYFLRGIRPALSLNREGRVPNTDFKNIYEAIKNGARLAPAAEARPGDRVYGS